MRIVLFLAGCLLALAAEPQEIYRWVDKDGIVHYADQPGAPDAERVLLEGLSEYEAQPPEPAAAASGAAPASSSTPVYAALRIAEPAPDQVFHGTDALVILVAELDGELQPGHSLLFFLDGQRIAPSDGFRAEAGPLQRGSHFLRAAVLDQNGVPVISSSQITIHARQASMQNPQQRAQPPPAPVPGQQPARQPRSQPFAQPQGAAGPN